jgi:AcrR family transcriptional regulator
MARPATNHQEKKVQILEAALKTFARHGYEGTTNKLIAEEAGKLIGENGKAVSPTLIYHYFPEGKAQLFMECLKQFPPLHKFAEALSNSMELPPEDFLRTVAKTYNELMTTEGVMPIFRLMVSEGPRNPELPRILASQLAPTFLLPLIGYFMQQSQLGRLRAMQPDQIVLQVFAPLLMRRLMLSTIPDGFRPITIGSDQEFIDSLVETLLHGTLIKD